MEPFGTYSKLTMQIKKI
uniref:Uncharacterized protein n=1 Tax=Arundo donax TaxID=35708 RepID=A0A0A9CBE1_ARUDO